MSTLDLDNSQNSSQSSQYTPKEVDHVPQRSSQVPSTRTRRVLQEIHNETGGQFPIYDPSSGSETEETVPEGGDQDKGDASQHQQNVETKQQQQREKPSLCKSEIMFIPPYTSS